MPTSAVALDQGSTHAFFPILPNGMQRSQIESLLLEVAPAIRL